MLEKLRHALPKHLGTRQANTPPQLANVQRPNYQGMPIHEQIRKFEDLIKSADASIARKKEELNNPTPEERTLAQSHREKRDLMAKEKKGTLTSNEEAKLKTLKSDLADMDDRVKHLVQRKTAKLNGDISNLQTDKAYYSRAIKKLKRDNADLYKQEKAVRNLSPSDRPPKSSEIVRRQYEHLTDSKGNVYFGKELPRDPKKILLDFKKTAPSATGDPGFEYTTLTPPPPKGQSGSQRRLFASDPLPTNPPAAGSAPMLPPQVEAFLNPKSGSLGNHAIYSPHYAGLRDFDPYAESTPRPTGTDGNKGKGAEPQRAAPLQPLHPGTVSLSSPARAPGSQPPTKNSETATTSRPPLSSEAPNPTPGLNRQSPISSTSNAHLANTPPPLPSSHRATNATPSGSGATPLSNARLKGMNHNELIDAHAAATENLFALPEKLGGYAKAMGTPEFQAASAEVQKLSGEMEKRGLKKTSKPLAEEGRPREGAKASKPPLSSEASKPSRRVHFNPAEMGNEVPSHLHSSNNPEEPRQSSRTPQGPASVKSQKSSDSLGTSPETDRKVDGGVIIPPEAEGANRDWKFE